MVDYELDDYNQEYFFNKEDEWIEYQNLLNDWDEPTPQEKDFSYNIFTLEQALSVINDISNSISNSASSLGLSCEETKRSLEKFIEDYTRVGGR